MLRRTSQKRQQQQGKTKKNVLRRGNGHRKHDRRRVIVIGYCHHACSLGDSTWDHDVIVVLMLCAFIGNIILFLRRFYPIIYLSKLLPSLFTANLRMDVISSPTTFSRTSKYMRRSNTLPCRNQHRHTMSCEPKAHVCPNCVGN